MPRHQLPPKETVPLKLLRAAALELLAQDFFTLLKMKTPESSCLEGFITTNPWRREWQSTEVFLPGEFHGQRNLVGYSPWGHKDLDTAD